MYTKTLFVLLLALTFLTSCSSVQVSQDFDSAYNFAGLTSYNWNTSAKSHDKDILKDDELLAKRFYTSIDANLAARGYMLADQPDFLVTIYYTVTKHIESDPVSPSFGFGFGRHSRYGGVGVATGQTIRQYNRGQLVVEIHEPSAHGLIWKGKGTHEVFTHNNPDKLTQMIEELVEGVLKQFPPT